MYAFYNHDSLLKPKVLKLFIQPTPDSYLVEQIYHPNTLLSLWVKMLNSLDDNTPDEVKAEDLKHNFILDDQESMLLNKFSYYYKNIPESEVEVDALLTDENAKKILAEAKSPDVQKLIDMFSDPQIIRTMKYAQKLMDYFGDIKNIKENQDNNKRVGD